MGISKHDLKRLRRWAMYQSETTVSDAHAYLLKTSKTVEDYDALKNIEICANEIRDFLVHFCKFEKSDRKKKKPGRDGVIFVNPNQPISWSMVGRRYYGLMEKVYSGKEKGAEAPL